MRKERKEGNDQEAEEKEGILGIEITDEDLSEYEFGEKLKDTKLGSTKEPQKRGPKSKPKHSIKDNMRKHFQKYDREGLINKLFELYDELRDTRLKCSTYKRRFERERKRPVQELKKYNDRVMRLMRKRIYEWKDEDLPYNNFKYLKQKLNVKMDSVKNVNDFVKLVELFLKVRKHVYEMSSAEKMLNMFSREQTAKIEKIKATTEKTKKGKPAQITDEEPDTSMSISPEMQRMLEDGEEEDVSEMDNNDDGQEDDNEKEQEREEQDVHI